MIDHGGGYNVSMLMQLSKHIDITDDTCSGHPRIAGTRVRVSNIVLWVEQGRGPEEIVASHPQLSLADVHAALAFYFDNRKTMDKLIREDEAFIVDLEHRNNATHS